MGSAAHSDGEAARLAVETEGNAMTGKEKGDAMVVAICGGGSRLSWAETRWQQGGSLVQKGERAAKKVVQGYG